MKATLLAIATSRSGSIVRMKKVEKTSAEAIQPAITSHTPHLQLAATPSGNESGGSRNCGQARGRQGGGQPARTSEGKGGARPVGGAAPPAAPPARAAA